MPEARCVVVNYNAGALLADCVGDLLAQTLPVEVAVVDNASGDQSLDALAGVQTQRLRIIRNAHNRGYAAACNQGAAGASCDYLAFVNPDCRMASESLQRLRLALENHAGAVIAGAWVSDPRGTEQRGTRRLLPTPKRALMTFTGLDRFAGRRPAFGGVNLTGPEPAGIGEVAAVNGACFVVKRAVFEQLGGFDEGFFLHCEDLDLFKRAGDAGGTIVLVPAARVTHAGGVPSASAPFRTHWHKHASMARYWRKHYPYHRLRALGTAGLWLHWLLGLPGVAWRSRRS